MKTKKKLLTKAISMCQYERSFHNILSKTTDILTKQQMVVVFFVFPSFFHLLLHSSKVD